MPNQSNQEQTDKPADKTAEVAQGLTENGMTLGNAPGQGSATGENGAQDKAVADAAEIVQGHIIPQDVLDAIEAQVAAFDPAHPTRVYDTPEHLREYLIAQYIVSKYPPQPQQPSGDPNFDYLVAVAEAHDVARYVVAHSAVSGHKQGEEFVPGKDVDVQRLLALGAITPVQDK